MKADRSKPIARMPNLSPVPSRRKALSNNYGKRQAVEMKLCRLQATSCHSIWILLLRLLEWVLSVIMNCKSCSKFMNLLISKANAGLKKYLSVNNSTNRTRVYLEFLRARSVLHEYALSYRSWGFSNEPLFTKRAANLDVLGSLEYLSIFDPEYLPFFDIERSTPVSLPTMLSKFSCLNTALRLISTN